MLRRAKPEQPLPLSLDGSTMVVCTEEFRPGAVARMVMQGQWFRLDSPVVRARPEHFAVRLTDLEQCGDDAA
jgi:hypothetical protein